MLPSLPNVIIRQATIQDVSDIIKFMDQAILVHRNLDWQPLMEWVSREPFFLRFENNRLTALLSCAPDPQGIAWIHAFGMNYWSSDIHKVWNSMLEPAVELLKNMQSNIYTVALNDWYKRLLLESGFNIRQNIIVLERAEKPLPHLPIPDDVIIRPMELTDLDQVVEVDHQAFDPVWVISRESMEHAYLSAAHSSVAEIDDRVIAYELSAENHFSAHLTRLAVVPAFKQANIGYSLTRRMLEHFSQKGIRRVTVNTQDDNKASIGLYKKLGFQFSGESFPVYWLRTIK